MSAHGHFMKDKHMTCPYNPAHSVLESRFSTHLTRCKARDARVNLFPCPFNSTHRIEVKKMGEHMSTCPDRGIMDRFKYKTESTLDIVPVDNRDIPCDENWDDVDVPSYNPQDKLNEDGSILVTLRNSTPAQQKRHREDRRRLFNTCVSKCKVGEFGAEQTDAVRKSSSVPYAEECGYEEFQYQQQPQGPSIAGMGRGSRM